MEDRLVAKLEQDLFGLIRRLSPTHALRTTSGAISSESFQQLVEAEGVPSFHPLLFHKVITRVPPLGAPTVDVKQWLRKNGVIVSSGKITGALDEAGGRGVSPAGKSAKRDHGGGGKEAKSKVSKTSSSRTGGLDSKRSKTSSSSHSGSSTIGSSSATNKDKPGGNITGALAKVARPGAGGDRDRGGAAVAAAATRTTTPSSSGSSQQRSLGTQPATQRRPLSGGLSSAPLPLPLPTLSAVSSESPSPNDAAVPAPAAASYRPAATPRFTAAATPLSVASSPEAQPSEGNQSCITFADEAGGTPAFNSVAPSPSRSSPEPRRVLQQPKRSPAVPGSGRGSAAASSSSVRKSTSPEASPSSKTKGKTKTTIEQKMKKTPLETQEAAEELLFNTLADACEQTERQDIGEAFLQRDVDYAGSLTVSQGLAMLVDLGLSGDRQLMAMLREATRETRAIPYVNWVRKYGRKRLRDKQAGVHIFGGNSGTTDEGVAAADDKDEKQQAGQEAGGSNEDVFTEIISEGMGGHTSSDPVLQRTLDVAAGDGVAAANEENIDGAKAAASPAPAIIDDFSRKDIFAADNVIQGDFCMEVPPTSSKPSNDQIQELEGLAELLKIAEATSAVVPTTTEKLQYNSGPPAGSYQQSVVDASRQAVSDLISRSLSISPSHVDEKGSVVVHGGSPPSSPPASPKASSSPVHNSAELQQMELLLKGSPPGVGGISSARSSPSSKAKPAEAAPDAAQGEGLAAGATADVYPHAAPAAEKTPEAALGTDGSGGIGDGSGDPNGVGSAVAARSPVVQELGVSMKLILTPPREGNSSVSEHIDGDDSAVVAGRVVSKGSIIPPPDADEEPLPLLRMVSGPSAMATQIDANYFPIFADGKTGEDSSKPSPAIPDAKEVEKAVPAVASSEPPVLAGAPASSAGGKPPLLPPSVVKVKKKEDPIEAADEDGEETPKLLRDSKENPFVQQRPAAATAAPAAVVPEKPPPPVPQAQPQGVSMISSASSSDETANMIVEKLAQISEKLDSLKIPPIAAQQTPPAAATPTEAKSPGPPAKSTSTPPEAVLTPATFTPTKSHEAARVARASELAPMAPFFDLEGAVQVASPPLTSIPAPAVVSEKGTPDAENSPDPVIPSIEESESPIPSKEAPRVQDRNEEKSAETQPAPAPAGTVVPPTTLSTAEDTTPTPAAVAPPPPAATPAVKVTSPPPPPAGNPNRIPVFISAARTVFATTVEGNTLYTETLTLREDKPGVQQDSIPGSQHPVQEQLAETWLQTHVPNPNVLNPTRFGREDYFTHRAMSLGADAVDFRSPLRWVSVCRLNQLKANQDERANPWPLMPENLLMLKHQLAHLGLYSNSGSNCLLLASLVALADFPDLVHRVFGNGCREDGAVDAGDAQGGTAESFYYLRLYLPAADFLPGEVAINDRVPCCAVDQDARTGEWQNWRPCFGRYGGSLWPYLLEKALAKLFSSYAMLNGVSPCLVWSVITGIAGYQVYFPWVRKQPHLVDVWGAGYLSADSHFAEISYWDVGENALSPASVWESLKNLTNEGHLVSCSFIAMAENSNASAHGLLAYQLYGLVECRELVSGHDTHKLVKVRNPYYMFEPYTGSLSRDEEWEKLGRDVTRDCKVGFLQTSEAPLDREIGNFLEQVSDPTTFWMTWAEFQNLVYNVVFSEFPLQGLPGRSKLKTLSLTERMGDGFAGAAGATSGSMGGGGTSGTTGTGFNKSVRFSASQIPVSDTAFGASGRGQTSRSPSRSALRSSGDVDLANIRRQGAVTDPLVINTPSAGSWNATARSRARSGSGGTTLLNTSEGGRLIGPSAEAMVGTLPRYGSSAMVGTSGSSATAAAAAQAAIPGNIMFATGGAPGGGGAVSSTSRPRSPSSPSARVYENAIRSSTASAGASGAASSHLTTMGMPVAYPAKVNMLTKSPGRLPGLYGPPSLAASSANLNLLNAHATVPDPEQPPAFPMMQMQLNGQMNSGATGFGGPPSILSHGAGGNSVVLQTSYNWQGGNASSSAAVQASSALPMPPAAPHYTAPVPAGGPTIAPSPQVQEASPPCGVRAGFVDMSGGGGGSNNLPSPLLYGNLSADGAPPQPGAPPTGYPQLRSPSEAGMTDADGADFAAAAASASGARPSAPPEEWPMPMIGAQEQILNAGRGMVEQPSLNKSLDLDLDSFAGLYGGGAGALRGNGTFGTAGANNMNSRLSGTGTGTTALFGAAPSMVAPVVTATRMSTASGTGAAAAGNMFDLRAATTAPLTPPSNLMVNPSAISHRTPPKSKRERNLPVWMQQALTITRRNLLGGRASRSSMGGDESGLDSVSKLALFHDLCRAKGNGIDQLRFQSLVSQHNPELTDQHLDALWRACDLDGDDFLNYSEFAAIF